MAHFHPREARPEPSALADDPLVLIVPGLNDSGPRHWQSIWEQRLPHCQRVELGMWDNPHRNTWVNKLNLAIHRAESAGRKVILAAHSLGCLATIWWAEYERPAVSGTVIGALLVAPPDVDRPGSDPRLARFSACPRQELPFPSFLVSSRNDPYCGHRTAYSLARDWGSRFADAGEAGHINAASDLGEWPFGLALLNQLIREYRLGLNAHAPASASPQPATPRHLAEVASRSASASAAAVTSPQVSSNPASSP